MFGFCGAPDMTTCDNEVPNNWNCFQAHERILSQTRACVKSEVLPVHLPAITTVVPARLLELFAVIAMGMGLSRA